MNCIIPFENRVKFPSQVKEICSISLEHEITKNDTEILGNFIVSGTYKEHELSVNTSDFKFTIPFNVELTTRIESDSLEFSIDNFTYDIEENEMVVKIDYIVTADDVREDIIEEEIIEDDPLDLIEVQAPAIAEFESKEETPSVIFEDNKKDDVQRSEVMEEEAIEINTQTESVASLQTEIDYMTYHIHIVKEEETLEMISMKYKVSKEEIEKLNDVNVLAKDIKLIIPVNNE